jgi:biopolymer transport protein ExbD
MSVGSGEGDPDVMIDINTTPLIDVMLVLIIMLIITIPIQTHAVKLNMPVGNPPPPPEPPQVVQIDVDFDGTIFWSGEQVDRETLDTRFRAAAAQPVQPEVHLRPQQARYIQACGARDGLRAAPGRHQDRLGGRGAVPRLGEFA